MTGVGVPIAGGRFLVTGGSGFIGSYVVALLAGAGAAEVRVLDQRPPRAEGPEADRIRFVLGDITRVEDLRGAVDGCAGVFHMAVLPLGACQADPRLCLTVNVDGTFNVLEAARDAGVRKVVFSSASSVYGDTLATMDESHPLNASTMYGVSKIAGELLLRTFGASYGLRYVVLRYMNVYGPGQTAGVIAATINRIKQGLRPIIVGDGRQSFDFVYVADVARANVLAMESDAADEAFNVGSGEEVSVRDLVQQLIEICGADLQPEFKADERALMQRRVGSSARAREKLGYQATTPFRLGLERVVEAALGRTPGLSGDPVRAGG